MTNKASPIEQVNLQMNEVEIENYLREHPDFFARHPEILTELQIIHEKQGTVSLTQIQLEQYRNKVKQQKKQLDSFISNAARNEKLYLSYADLNFALSCAQNRAQIEAHLHYYLCEQLGLSALHLLLLNEKEAGLAELAQRSLLSKKLAKRQYYFGRLSKHEKDALFADIDVGSVALMKIENGKKAAILAIASRDDGHFTPDMDTSLLDYLRQYLEFHLFRALDAAS